MGISTSLNRVKWISATSILAYWGGLYQHWRVSDSSSSWRNSVKFKNSRGFMKQRCRSGKRVLLMKSSHLIYEAERSIAEIRRSWWPVWWCGGVVGWWCGGVGARGNQGNLPVSLLTTKLTKLNLISEDEFGAYHTVLLFMIKYIACLFNLKSVGLCFILP